MPNWCANVVEFSHADPAMIDKVIKSSDGLLEAFIPCPKALTKTRKGYYPDKRKMRRLGRTQKRNLLRYGHSDWYSWRVANWGTKWDFDFSVKEVVDNTNIIIAFDSAWSPPLEAYDTLRDLGFYIKAYYYEPGMAYAGIWEDGVDSTYEVLSADQAENDLPPELDGMFAISEMLSEYESEEVEE